MHLLTIQIEGTAEVALRKSTLARRLAPSLAKRNRTEHPVVASKCCECDDSYMLIYFSLTFLSKKSLCNNFLHVRIGSPFVCPVLRLVLQNYILNDSYLFDFLGLQLNTVACRTLIVIGTLFASLLLF
jgi:hypothetical protein